jgi:histidine triad (HIT) family protein
VTDCPFCSIIAGEAPATFLADGTGSVAIEPLNPVTPGHFLVIPRTHVKDAYENPSVTATTMHDAAQWAHMFSWRDERYASVNLITSIGRPATQSVFHLHIHVVPRAENDGLALPWYSGRGKGKG